MKCRYTLTAATELDKSVSYLLTHAPHVAGKFADSIDTAVSELLEHPYSAQQTAQAGVYRKYVRAFRYSIFYAVDVSSEELVILNVRHAARRWPWQD